MFLSDFMIKINLGFMTVFTGFRRIQGLIIRRGDHSAFEAGAFQLSLTLELLSCIEFVKYTMHKFYESLTNTVYECLIYYIW